MHCACGDEQPWIMLQWFWSSPQRRSSLCNILIGTLQLQSISKSINQSIIQKSINQPDDQSVNQFFFFNFLNTHWHADGWGQRKRFILDDIELFNRLTIYWIWRSTEFPCFTLKSEYRKFPKYLDTQKICCNQSKIWTMWLYHRVMSPNDADRMADSVDPDQTPLGAVWSGSALFA